MDSFAEWTDIALPQTADDAFQMESALGSVVHDSNHGDSSSFACEIESAGYIVLAVPRTSTLTETSKVINILRDVGSANLPKLTVKELASRLTGEGDPSPCVKDEKQQYSSVAAPKVDSANAENSLSWISFQIGGTVFTAPSSRLLKYEFFQNLLTKKARKNGHIPLKGISADEFCTFIKLLYPLHQEKIELSKPQWITILKLATTWNVIELRQRAIDEINHYRLGNLEYALLGKEFKVQSWLREGYLGLIQQEAHIRAADVTQLGLPTTVALHRARETLYKDYYTQYRSTMASTPDTISARTLIQNLVNAEVENRGQRASIFERIHLARDLGVPDFLLAAYNELVDREDSLTLEEVDDLGLSTALSIWRARITLRREYKEKVKTSCNISYPVDFPLILGEILDHELNVKASKNVPQRPHSPRADPDPKSSSPAMPNKPILEPQFHSEHPSSQSSELVGESSGPRFIPWGPIGWASGQNSKSSVGSSAGDKGGRKNNGKK